MNDQPRRYQVLVGGFWYELIDQEITGNLCQATKEIRAEGDRFLRCRRPSFPDGRGGFMHYPTTMVRASAIVAVEDSPEGWDGVG